MFPQAFSSNDIQTQRKHQVQKDTLLKIQIHFQNFSNIHYKSIFLHRQLARQLQLTFINKKTVLGQAHQAAMYFWGSCKMDIKLQNLSLLTYEYNIILNYYYYYITT